MVMSPKRWSAFTFTVAVVVAVAVFFSVGVRRSEALLPSWFSIFYAPECPADLPKPYCKCNSIPQGEELYPKRATGSRICCKPGKETILAQIFRSIHQQGSLVESLVIENCTTPIGYLKEMPKIMVSHLAIRNCGLTGLGKLAFKPSAFWLKSLDLRNNSLKSTDFGIHQLPNLRLLNLQGNKILRVPKELGQYNPMLSAYCSS